MDLSSLEDISYGMYLITTSNGKEDAGCIINTLTQITSKNPIVSVSINKNNYTHECISKSKKFAVSVLHEQSAPDIIATFGFSSGRDTDKFSKVEYSVHGMMPVCTGDIQPSISYICFFYEKMVHLSLSKFMYQKSAAQLWLKPGRLWRHQKASICY